MAYTKLNIKDGEVLTAAHLAHIESGIAAADIQSDLIAHTNNKSNPHKVTKEQIGLNEVENIRQYSTNNPPIAIQSTAPSDTSLIWVDTSDDFEEDVTNIEDRIIERIKALSSLPHGGSKEWLDKNGDKTQLYQINGYIWEYIESDGWTKSATQFLVVSSESAMTNEGGTNYLLRSGDEGIVYTYAGASGDVGVPVYSTLPTTAKAGDIVAVGGKKYRASVTNIQVPDYVNKADLTSSDWVAGARLNSSGGTTAETADIHTTNFIGPIKEGDVIRIQGMDMTTHNSYPVRSNKTQTGQGITRLSQWITSSSTTNYEIVKPDGSFANATGGQVTVGSYEQEQNGYWRFSGKLNKTANDVIITINEEIKTKTETKVTWTEIGEYIAPTDAGWTATVETYDIIDSLNIVANNGESAVYSSDGYLYTYISGSAWTQTSKYTAPATADDVLSTSSTNAVQNRIITAELNAVNAKADVNAESILALQNEVEALGGGTSSEAVTIPSYWVSMVNEKTETVKALQTAGGKNCVSFAYASDTHIPDNDNGRTTDIGKVMAKMLDNCEIPFAVLAGDINTRASYATEAGLVNAQNQMPVHLAPLWGTDRLLMALGNHDGCWGDSSGYYRHQFTPERMWQIFFRGQALDFRRVFSDDGLYYYVDNVAQKTRFIVLNSHFGGEYAENSNGWAVNNRFGTSCYGQEQLDWLADVALNMPDGYDAIIFAHVPPNINYTVDKAQFIGIVNAYNNKTLYTGSYTGISGWTSSNVSVDFTDANGEIIAMFTGHVHGDSIDTTTMTCPILTILSAGASANDPYKNEAPTRKAGTATETSFDVVTINKNTRTIHCTRIGAGSDRETIY